MIETKTIRLRTFDPKSHNESELNALRNDGWNITNIVSSGRYEHTVYLEREKRND